MDRAGPLASLHRIRAFLGHRICHGGCRTGRGRLAKAVGLLSGGLLVTGCGLIGQITGQAQRCDQLSRQLEAVLNVAVAPDRAARSRHQLEEDRAREAYIAECGSEPARAAATATVAATQTAFAEAKLRSDLATSSVAATRTAAGADQGCRIPRHVGASCAHFCRIRNIWFSAPSIGPAASALHSFP